MTSLRRRYPPEVRREMLLDVGLELAETHNYTNVSAQMVAEKADVTRALVSRYFGTMVQFRRALMRRAVDTERLRVVAQGLACGDAHAVKADDSLKSRALAAIS